VLYYPHNRRGNREQLATVVTESYLSSINPVLKSLAKTGGIYEWTFHRHATPPAILHTQVAKVQVPHGEPEWIAQVSVRFNTVQSLALYSKAHKLIGGDPLKEEQVSEVLVFEKFLNRPETWKIAGKLQK
jgi:hypothetical protein